jgi:hypothetical protein
MRASVPPSVTGPRSLLAICLGAGLLTLAACGGGGDSTTTSGSSTETTTITNPSVDQGSGSCTPIEEVDVPLSGQHRDSEFTAADYPTNPPAGGDHNPTPIDPGTFYTEPPRLGEAVHLLEHGAVIGWTNNLSSADQKGVEETFNEIFKDGYYQLAVVENPDLDVPFALSAWGALQKCEQVDTAVTRPFVEEWYGSPKSAEGGLACEGDARSLPNC